jgi:Cys-tRNA(Pro)/Cys-tRNA(Cys) deacylase
MATRETRATHAARAAGVAFTVHEYTHETGEAYALEAATALGVDPERVFKTLVVALDDRLVVCIVPAAHQLDLRSLGKRAQLAPAQRAESVTGYVAGGISPLGQRRQLDTVVDESALGHETVYVSGGRRGLEIELAPTDLVALCGAEVRGLT